MFEDLNIFFCAGALFPRIKATDRQPIALRVLFPMWRVWYDARYVGSTRGTLHACVNRHKQKTSLCLHKHYHFTYGKVPKDLLRHFSALKKWKNKHHVIGTRDATHWGINTNSERAGDSTLGRARYINILTWLRDFQNKFLYLVLFLCIQVSLIGYWKPKET